MRDHLAEEAELRTLSIISGHNLLKDSSCSQQTLNKACLSSAHTWSVAHFNDANLRIHTIDSSLVMDTIARDEVRVPVTMCVALHIGRIEAG